MAGWGFIMFRKPFEIGDRVQIGDHAGDVIDLGFFQFKLIEIGNWVDADQSTGRIIHVPNGKVFNEVQANYNKGFDHIWHEIPILITFESDWAKAKDILTTIINNNAKSFTKEADKKLKQASAKYLIFYSKLTPIVYTSVKDSGICLTIRYLCEPRRRRSTQEKIWEETLIEFSKFDNIDFAYPTTRFFNNTFESKTAIEKPGLDG
jgi:small-conductance mechanosensitive channel